MKSNIALAALLAFGTTTIASATTFVVNKSGDDGSTHTLRWAIEQNNLNPSGNRIQIIPTGPMLPFVIKLNSLLPPILGPATIEGNFEVRNSGLGIQLLGSTVGGNLSASGNTGFVEIEDNTIVGNARVVNNTGAVTVTGNTIGGNLVCRDNVPPAAAADNAVAGKNECP